MYNNYRDYPSGGANNYKCLRSKYGSPQIYKTINHKLSNLIDKNVVIAEDFNTPLTTMDRSSRQTINKETRALNDTLDQMDLTGIFRTLHPKATEYTFFLSAHGTFSKIEHILGHKTALHKYKELKSYHAYFQTKML